MTVCRKWKKSRQTTMEKIIYLIFLVIFTVQADNTPVLIWSPSRSMSDMPQSYIGHKVGAEKFYDNYLQPLSSDPQNNLVVFAQNKLSIEDFTSHADVYNPHSDGGVFKNVKSAMEEDFSVQLPSVASPMSSINKLKKSYTGRVVKVDNPDDIDKMELTDGKSYLILVTLKPVRGVDEAKSFEENDQMIGKCIHHLNKREVKFTALYTAHSAAKRDAGGEFKSRHLLAADGDTKEDRMFFSDDLVMMSLRYVDLTVSKPTGVQDPPDEVLKGNATRFPASSLDLKTKLVEDNTTSNNTYSVQMKLQNPDGNLTLKWYLSFNYANEWKSSKGNITYQGGQNTSDFSFEEIPVNYKILAPAGFSYHCTRLYPTLQMKFFNNTENLRIGIALAGFQLQAYTGNTTEVFTDFVWDCVEFFTIPIWMGIITSVILVIIIFFALSMVANITTMDRFDDPKGKPLTITVNE